MKYIVLDLEWNRPEGEEGNQAQGLVFEIIEIGAVKINEQGFLEDRFSELVKPEAYHHMNVVTERLIHLSMEQLEEGASFREVMSKFLDWCGEEYVFCTWGSGDLTELQRNMDYHGMKPLCGGPLMYYDIQKIFAFICEADKKTKRTLEYAVDYLGIKKEIPFHRACEDAFYTGEVFRALYQKDVSKFAYVSYDVYRPPKSRGEEIKVQFPTYVKYISRTFPDKAAAMRDREVLSTRCYLCRCNVKRKIKWFTVNHRHYYCLAFCERHGYLKGKIRLIKAEDKNVFAVKTTRLISGMEAEKIIQKNCKAKANRKRAKENNA